MPAAVVPAVLAGVGAGTTFTAATLTLSIGFSWSAFGASLVLGAISKVLTPKPKRIGGSSSGASFVKSGLTTQVKQPILSRNPVYGEIRISGGIVFVASTENNKYLHMVIALAPHEVEKIGEIWIDDYPIAEDHLDGNGVVNTGRYEDKVRIKKHLGTTGQSADSDLTAEVSDWTTNHKLSGVAYIYVRLEWDQDIFPNGIPNFSAWVKGKKILDTRTTLTSYSNNMALVTYDYLIDSGFGLGAATTEIDTDFVNAAANTCDEFVTTANYDTTVSSIDTATEIITLSNPDDKVLYYQTGDKVRLVTTGSAPGGLAINTDYYVIAYQRKTTLRIKLASSYANSLAGTAIDITSAGSGTHTIRKIGEPRYSGAILLNSEDSIKENIESCLSGMGGKLIYAGGLFRMLAAGYQSPTVTFTLDEIISPINIQTKISQRERFNTVRGTYISPINDGQPSDYPQITNATYKTEDNNEEIVRQLDFPSVQRPHTAQRLAKIELEKSRQEITFTADFNLNAFQVQCGDTAYFTIDRFGWSSKVFEIVGWQLNSKEENGVAIPYISMTMRETASGVYDWNSGEETSIDLAPNTNLPDPFTVAAVTGLAANSETVDTQGGDYLYKILLNWNAITDQFVLNGGHIEIQYKKSTELTYRPTYVIDGSFTFAEVTLAAQLNEEYDIRVRAVNNVGVRSAYTSILNFVVGTSGGVGSTEDWGDFVTSPPTTTEDWGSFSGGDSPAATTEDWGYFT